MEESLVTKGKTLKDVIGALKLSQTIITDSHEISRGFAISGAAFAILPQLTAIPYVEQGILRLHTITNGRRNNPPLATHQLALVFRREHRFENQIRSMGEEIADRMKS